MSKIIGLDKAFSLRSAALSKTALSRLWRYVGLGVAVCLAGGILAPQTASAQFWGYGGYYGGWAPEQQAYPQGYPQAYPRPYYGNGPYARPYQGGDGSSYRQGGTLRAGD